jgi:hypothetical protein
MLIKLFVYFCFFEMIYLLIKHNALYLVLSQKHFEKLYCFVLNF